MTEPGRPVAVLSPWADETDPLERLIASGRARRGRGDLLSIEPVRRAPSRDATDALAAERDERL